MGADQGAGNNGCGASAAAAHLGAQYAPQQTTDHHACLFILSLIGRAAAEANSAGGNQCEYHSLSHTRNLQLADSFSVDHGVGVGCH